MCTNVVLSSCGSHSSDFAYFFISFLPTRAPSSAGMRSVSACTLTCMDVDAQTCQFSGPRQMCRDTYETNVNPECDLPTFCMDGNATCPRPSARSVKIAAAGTGTCMHIEFKINVLVAQSKCGNGIIDFNETCDCGERWIRRNLGRPIARPIWHSRRRCA